MPRTKGTTKKTTTSRSRKSTETKPAETEQSRFPNLPFTQSYTSLIYGVITVVVLFALIFAGIRNFTDRQATGDIAEDGLQTVSEQKEEDMYVVEEGDSLWAIAEKVYNDGYRWEMIAKANNLSEPYGLEKGTRLIIPAEGTQVLASEDSGAESADGTETPSPTVIQSPTSTPVPQVSPTDTPGNSAGESSQKITAGSYRIQQGDYLWNIAVRAYGDGYKWVEIWRANQDKIQDPNLVYPDTELKLPR